MDTLRLDLIRLAWETNPLCYSKDFACQQYSYEQSLLSYRFRHGSSAPLPNKMGSLKTLAGEFKAKISI